MTNHRHTRSGFPDLTMWDTNQGMNIRINHVLYIFRFLKFLLLFHFVLAGRVAFVEVKGPNDSLSNKQILWLDYLRSFGIEAVVTHIEPLNSKRVQVKSQTKRPPKKMRKKCDDYDSSDDFVAP